MKISKETSYKTPRNSYKKRSVKICMEITHLCKFVRKQSKRVKIHMANRKFQNYVHQSLKVHRRGRCYDIAFEL